MTAAYQAARQSQAAERRLSALTGSPHRVASTRHQRDDQQYDDDASRHADADAHTTQDGPLLGGDVVRAAAAD